MERVLVSLGLNHNTADVALREQVVFAEDQLAEALRRLRKDTGVEEAVIISTCNRTELYIAGADSSDPAGLLDWLGRYHKLNADQLRGHTYYHAGREGLHHLLRVASGLDSMVLGEPQILGQAKTAFSHAVKAGSVGRILDRAFRHAFTVAKQVRTETAIGANAVSVAYAAVQLARQIFGDLGASTAMLIGAGETIELTAEHLREQGQSKLIVANRSLERARQLADRFQGEAIALSDIPQHLHRCDIVVASTASQLPILGKGSVESAIKKRRHKPMFLVDMAVPRDIEPEVDELADAYLYTVDDLREVVEENMRSRQDAAAEAERIIEHQVGEFMRWLRAQDAVGMIRGLRDWGEVQKADVLDSALQKLRRGESPEAALQYLAHALTNRLLHLPSEQLRKAGEAGDRELLARLGQVFTPDQEDSENP